MTASISTNVADEPTVVKKTPSQKNNEDVPCLEQTEMQHRRQDEPCSDKSLMQAPISEEMFTEDESSIEGACLHTAVLEKADREAVSKFTFPDFVADDTLPRYSSLSRYNRVDYGVSVDGMLTQASSMIGLQVEPSKFLSGGKSFDRWSSYQIIVHKVCEIKLRSSVEVLPGTNLKGHVTCVNEEKGTMSPLGDLPCKPLSQQVTYDHNLSQEPYYYVNCNDVLASKQKLRIKLYLTHPEQPLLYLGTMCCSMLDIYRQCSQACGRCEMSLQADSPHIDFARMWIWARPVEQDMA